MDPQTERELLLVINGKLDELTNRFQTLTGSFEEKLPELERRIKELEQFRFLMQCLAAVVIPTLVAIITIIGKVVWHV
jgi:hypothetical protein